MKIQNPKPKSRRYLISLKALVSFSLLMIIMVGCQKKEVTLKTDFENQAENKTRLVPESVARNIAEIFTPALFFVSEGGNTGVIGKSLKENGFTGNPVRTNKTPDKPLKIKEEVVIRDHSGVPALYVFNYENDKGYLIVTGDSSVRPVLAYVEKGVFQTGNAPGGAVMWLNKTINNVEIVRKGLYDNTKSAKRAWKKYFDKMTQTGNMALRSTNGVKTNFIDPPPQDDPCIQDPNYFNAQSNTIGPLLPTQWGQLDTYNDLLGNWSCGSSFNGAPPTGCVATAMAQVIRYWQTPSTYNYSGMPANIGNYYVQQLMADAGASVSMEYDCAGSHPPNEWWLPGGILLTPSASERIANALTGTFGYSSASHGSYSLNSDYFTVVSNIANNRPVIFGGYSDWNSFWYYPEGTGHVWACDGTLETVYTFCFNGSSMSETYLMFHMNWGWQEWGTTNNFNGWFAFDSWYISGIGKQYVYFNDYAYNIHP